MIRKILAAAMAAILLLCAAGCSSEYVMTEADLALQNSMVGLWLADDSTGYNQYDTDGSFLSLTVLEFTSDYKYRVHTCMPGDGAADGYVATYSPSPYTIEKELLKVVIDGISNYAKIEVSEDGSSLYWITDDERELYTKLSDERIYELGISVYDPDNYTEDGSEAASE